MSKTIHELKQEKSKLEEEMNKILKKNTYDKLEKSKIADLFEMILNNENKIMEKIETPRIKKSKGGKSVKSKGGKKRNSRKKR